MPRFSGKKRVTPKKAQMIQILAKQTISSLKTSNTANF